MKQLEMRSFASAVSSLAVCGKLEAKTLKLQDSTNIFPYLYTVLMDCTLWTWNKLKYYTLQTS